jgi:hypothetical protein
MLDVELAAPNAEFDHLVPEELDNCVLFVYAGMSLKHNTNATQEIDTHTLRWWPSEWAVGDRQPGCAFGCE